MIFERDAKGLLHQVNMTLEDVAAAGRNLNLTTVQTFYVLFTPTEESNFAAQKAEAARKQKEIEDKEKEALAAKSAEIKEQRDKQLELANAQRAAEAEKDRALALALEQIQRLNAKVDALSR